MCKKKKHIEKYANIKKTMTDIELPEILGKIQPVKVNKDSSSKNIYSIYENV